MHVANDVLAINYHKSVENTEHSFYRYGLRGTALMKRTVYVYGMPLVEGFKLEGGLGC